MKFLNFSLVLLMILLNGKTFAMVRALNTSATGMAAQEANVNTISNNIANVNTTGFKRDRAETEDLLYETQVLAGSRSSFSSRYNVGIQIGSGSKISAIKKEFTTGSPQITNNPFDLMINGDGFFAIILPNNLVKYTRDGSFSVDNTGTIVTKSGYKLFPGITIPSASTNIKISESGAVEAYLKDQIEPISVGSIPVYTFTNPVGLINAGGNLYDVSQASGPPIEQIPGQSNAGVIMQGTLESSNVSIMTEMTNLIRAQRAYEMNSKVMGVADQMLQTINNIR
jgi:flagellar basal-body rod protein FlgG